jgi:hypothetical protein
MRLVAAIAARTRCLSAVRTAVVFCLVAAATAASAAPAPALSPPAPSLPAPSPPAAALPAPDPAIVDADRLAARGKRPAAIAALRRALAREDTADRRCALGLLLAAPPKPDLPRAHLYLLACPAARDPALAARGASARAGLDRTLRQSDLSPVEVATDGTPVRLTVDTLRGDAVTAPARLWLPAGRHRLTGVAADGRTASAELAVTDGNRAMVTLILPPPPRPAAAGTVDFGDDEPAEVHRGAPAKVEHDSLLPAKYRKGMKARPRP